MFVVGGVGTASSWFLMKPFGRRDIYLYGQATCCSIMMITAILGTVNREPQGAQWGIGALLIIFTFVYYISIGPVCYSLVAEIGSTRLRSRLSSWLETFVSLESNCMCARAHYWSTRHVTLSSSPYSKLLAIDRSIVFSL
jgi:hypothetical protein